MFPSILKELRIENGISQTELAKAVGVSQGTIFFWENGVNEPTAGYIVKLAKFFGITTDELLGADKNTVKVSQNNGIVSVYNKLSFKNKNLALKILNDIYESQK